MKNIGNETEKNNEKEALLYDRLPRNLVKCRLCPHSCTIMPGKKGICGVRENKYGKLIALTYGRPVSVNIDPIEKKPLYHFLPGSKILSLGTLGCNLACDFCQNWEISQASKSESANFDYPEVSPEKIVELALQNRYPSIAYTYNEPTIFFEYAIEIMELAKKNNLKNVWVSNGFISQEALSLVVPYLDSINIDLKSFSDEFYKKICRARLQPVLETIKHLKKVGVWQEITTLLIPGKNDSEEELKKISGFIANVDRNIPWHISSFHPDYKMTNTEKTSIESLELAYAIGKKSGLNFVYVGNIIDERRSSTLCPKCNLLLIKRKGMSTEAINIKSGKCPKCKEKIAGIWSEIYD